MINTDCTPTGHEHLSKAVMLVVLVDGKKQAPFIIMKRNDLVSQKIFLDRHAQMKARSCRYARDMTMYLLANWRQLVKLVMAESLAAPVFKWKSNTSEKVSSSFCMKCFTYLPLFLKFSPVEFYFSLMRKDELRTHGRMADSSQMTRHSSKERVMQLLNVVNDHFTGEIRATKVLIQTKTL